MLRNIPIIVYLVIGAAITSSHHYFTHPNSLTRRDSSIVSTTWQGRGSSE